MGELGSINDIGCNHGQLYKELKREKKMLSEGVKFIFPLPYLKIVSKN